MSTFRLPCAVVLMFCATAGQAQVHRCDSAGQAVFQDMPCADKDRALQIGTEIPSLRGTAVRIDRRVARRYYEVVGNSYPVLVESLRRSGPNGFHGMASWRVTYQYDSIRETPRESSLCRIANLRFAIDGEILMPRWQPNGSPDRELLRRWDGYLAALDRHERGHIQHADELIATARQRILANGPQPCDALQARTQASFDKVLRSMQQRDREYDMRTGHGATQGAVF